MPSYVAVYSTIPTLTKCLRAVLPNIRFQEVLPGSTDGKVHLKEAEVIVGDNNLLGLEFYNLPAAKWVQGTWAGVEKMMEHYDTSKPKPSFLFTRFSDHHFGCAMGEYVVASIVNHERDLAKAYGNQHSRLWDKEGKISNHRFIADLTVGLLGTGTIGTYIAQVLKTFKANVWGLVRTIPDEKRKSPHVDVYRLNSELPDLLRNCDYIVNILPSTPETRGLLNGDILKHCERKKTILINVGRGSIIKEEDLVNALEKEWLSAALLDVFENEPLPPSSPLWTMPQVTITPHVSGCSRPEDIAEFFKHNYLKYQNQQPLDSVLDFEKGY